MDKEDILSRFLVERKKDPEKMTDQYLRDIILNFILAGKDSTANTLSWFFYVLCKNPLIQVKIVEEIREVFGNNMKDNGNVDDFVASITEEVLEKMHYLHATLTETLRLYPAVPVVLLPSIKLQHMDNQNQKKSIISTLLYLSVTVSHTHVIC